MTRRIKHSRHCLMALLILGWSAPIQASDKYVTLYSGRYSDNRLGDILVSKPIEFWHSYLAVVAVSKAFAFESPRHQWELEAQLGKHYGGQTHWELNGVVIYRWQYFPWRRYLQTSFALGDGLSYATRTPPLEEESTTNVGATKLLNYILVELTVAPPQVNNWSFVVRVHHRSGVYGIFDDVEGGSNVVAAGVKFVY